MSYHFYILLILALADVILAVWMLKAYSQSLSVRYYASFLFGLGLLAIVNMLTLSSVSASTLLLVDRLGYVVGALTFIMLLLFSFYYPTPSKYTPPQPYVFWLVPTVFFPAFVFLPSFISSVSISGNVLKEVHGSLFLLFPIFIGLTFLWTMWNLWRKFGMAVHQNKSIQLFIIVLTVTSLLGFINDAILRPMGLTSFPYLGVESSALIFALSIRLILQR